MTPALASAVAVLDLPRTTGTAAIRVQWPTRTAAGRYARQPGQRRRFCTSPRICHKLSTHGHTCGRCAPAGSASCTRPAPSSAPCRRPTACGTSGGQPAQHVYYVISSNSYEMRAQVCWGSCKPAVQSEGGPFEGSQVCDAMSLMLKRWCSAARLPHVITTRKWL
jgi:hypothetical protein